MEPNLKYSHLASEESLQKTVKALKENQFSVEVVETGTEAKERALSLIPTESSIFTSVSETTRLIGLAEILDTSDEFISVRNKLNSLSNETQSREKKQIAATPDFVVGSVHAITEDGSLFVASNTGSQLPAYVYGAEKVIFIVSTKKIVKDRTEALKRIEEYSYPLEDERAQKAYGIHSNVSKVLMINRDQPGRTSIIFVKEDLGF